MANNFFDLVQEGFFNPFTGTEKRLNYDILRILYNKMNLDSSSYSKEDLAEWIEEYLDNAPIIAHDDETNEAEVNNREAALHKIRYFTRYGWLSEDIQGLNTVYQMDDNAIIILKAMMDAIDNDSRPLEYSTYAYNIYSGLINLRYNRAIEVVESIYKSAQELSDRLRSLNTQVKKFLNKLLKDKNASPSDILKTLYIDYQNKIVLKSFKYFREKDNPSKYKGTILNKIDELLSDNEMEILVDEYIKRKESNDESPEAKEAAREFYEARLGYVKNLFEGIEETLIQLDKKNSNYVNTARSRLNFLLNEETNIEGKLIEALKGLALANDELYDDVELRLYTGSRVDSKSLYTPRTQRQRVESSIDVTLDELIAIEEIERARKRFEQENKFSCHSINIFVRNALGLNEQIHAKEILVNSYDDLIRLFMIKLYSENNNIAYRVKFLDDNLTDNYYVVKFKNDKTGYNDSFGLKDFIIERK